MALKSEGMSSLERVSWWKVSNQMDNEYQYLEEHGTSSVQDDVDHIEPDTASSTSHNSHHLNEREIASSRAFRWLVSRLKRELVLQKKLERTTRPQSERRFSNNSHPQGK